ncbi:MAG: M23 family metallopeptidase [Clostridia bacterium]|nr:M23 family metallopeptidase [Clostridia bacterium]
MNKFISFIKKEKGLYRIAFCICIIFLCVLTLIVTSYEESKPMSFSTNVEKSNEDLFDKSGDESKKNSVEPEIVSGVYHVDEKTSDERMPELNDMSFAPPISGEVIKEFSPNYPLYSKTMDDWRIHEGIDIKTNKGESVLAAQSGMVDYVGFDLNMGYTIIIKNNEFECIYMSLSPDVSVKVGDYVIRGQHIGTISDSAVSELCDGIHLHFAIKKDGYFVNPSEYIYY